MLTIEQLAAAVLAVDPLVCRQAQAREEPDGDHLQAVLDKLHEQRPGLQWAVLDVEECRAYVYDDLLEAAEDYDPEHDILTACRVGRGMLYLSMHGKWTAFPASGDPGTAPDERDDPL
jgi:hypothetical protein